MSAIKHDDLLIRIVKELNDIKSALNRTVASLPLYDIDNENAPDALTASQNNYAPGNYDALKLTSTLAVSITGISGGVKGRSLKLFNTGSYEITFPHNSASSLDANRIYTDSGQSIVLGSGGWVEFYYDSAVSKWRATGLGSSTSGDKSNVKVSLTANLSIDNAASTTITWNNIGVDTDGFFSVATPTIITIPSTGWYYVFAIVAWNANSAGLRHTKLFITGGEVNDTRNAVDGDGTFMSISKVVFLAKGHTVDVRVWQNSGGALDILASYCELRVARID